jgi:hypothetical protein
VGEDVAAAESVRYRITDRAFAAGLLDGVLCISPGRGPSLNHATRLRRGGWTSFTLPPSNAAEPAELLKIPPEKLTRAK